MFKNIHPLPGRKKRIMKNVICCMCGKQISISNDTYYHGVKRNPDNPQFYCKECYHQMKSQRMKKFTWYNLSDEEKLARAQKMRNKYYQLSDEEKQARRDRQSQIMKDRWDGLSDEEKEKRRDFARNIFKNLKLVQCII